MSLPQEEMRPSPEAMLKAAQAEEKGKQRGRLKIFLGYAAGVGKTYTMLEAARQLKAEGREVVAAYVESHGRAETDALLEGLEVLPKARCTYQGVALTELDLDATLARKPEVALVDELAHTNAPGCRHEKRWQDIEELLAAGIDVFTTVNVQHFESLNDIVAQVTGIPIRETVPDSLLDLAAEIMLVDIPPEALLQRLSQGKVYIPEQASLAAKKFFRPGNLIALRELALRRTAARVDDEMRTYMETRSIVGPWPVTERLLVCASGSPFSEQLIRTTRRLADELKAQWFTVYIETPRLAREQQENRERVWHDLRLAESLGAEVATITASSVPQAIIEYAIRHNVTRIVVGKPTKPRWRELLRPPIVDQIIRLSGSIHVHVVSFKQETIRQKSPVVPPPKRGSWSDYLVSLTLVAAATASFLPGPALYFADQPGHGLSAGRGLGRCPVRFETGHPHRCARGAGLRFLSLSCPGGVLPSRTPNICSPFLACLLSAWSSVPWWPREKCGRRPCGNGNCRPRVSITSAATWPWPSIWTPSWRR